MGWSEWAMGLFFVMDDDRRKKDDDDNKLSKKKGPGAGHGWNPARIQPRRGARRLMLVVLLGALTFIFIKYIPTDVPIRDRRHPFYKHPRRPAPAFFFDRVHARPPPPPDQPPRPPGPDNTPSEGAGAWEGGNVADGAAPLPARDYNGPLVFSNLSPSLHGMGDMRDGGQINRNVLFAAASPRSVARLLPMACQMSTELRSYVHFALMSRSEIPMSELKDVSGVDELCVVFFHDARPDSPAISTDSRLENGVGRAMHMINVFMHPQAIIVDGSAEEEAYLLQAMRTETPDLGSTLVELPADHLRNLKWITKLDSASLHAWNDVHIDIVIQAQVGTAGSLLRLLKSLSEADYTGCAIPHLTIELPQDIDEVTEEFLEDFKWPPRHLAYRNSGRMLSVRHRVHQRRSTIEESILRFLESWWPSNPADFHVLVLSPRVELSPQYFHYLVYTLLEYRHSNPAIFQRWGERLLGISLDLPTGYLDGTSGFRPPSKRKLPPSQRAPKEFHGSFLWQAPNSNAVLYLGEKWVELHGYVSTLLAAQRVWHQTPRIVGERHIARMYPAWLEHAVKLCRARGYWTLYPGAAAASNLATVHTELFQPPEEYSGAAAGRSSRRPPNAREVRLTPTDLLDSLPDGGELPHLTDLPVLTWDGQPTTPESLVMASLEYTDRFREQTLCKRRNNFVGVGPDKQAQDLFCVNE